MDTKSIILAVGLLFAENTLNFIIHQSTHVQNALVKYMVLNGKQSIVRKIGSYLSFIHARRPVIIGQELLNEKLLDHCDGTLKKQCKCIVIHNTSENNTILQTKVEELERELLTLQVKVSQLLERSSGQTNIEIAHENISSNTVKVPTLCSSLPSLPPPPPPLPPTPEAPKPLVIVKSKTATSNSVKNVPQNDITSSIVEELCRRPPKLRHVPQTPGGRPVRHKPPLSDPADILTAVLRRRFDAFHSPPLQRVCSPTVPVQFF